MESVDNVCEVGGWDEVRGEWNGGVGAEEGAEFVEDPAGGLCELSFFFAWVWLGVGYLGWERKGIG